MRDAAAQPERDKTLNIFQGTPLRDASVEPEPQDHLPPVNAGTDDPHGPNVVSTQAYSPRSGNAPAVGNHNPGHTA